MTTDCRHACDVKSFQVVKPAGEDGLDDSLELGALAFELEGWTLWIDTAADFGLITAGADSGTPWLEADDLPRCAESR